MANNVTIKATVRDAGINAELANVTKLRLYAGTQPATPETALGGGNTLLSDHVATPASSSGGSASITIGNDTDADNSGTATWGSLLTSGNVRQIDFSVGTSGCDLNLTDNIIVQHGLVIVSSFTYTHP